MGEQNGGALRLGRWFFELTEGLRTSLWVIPTVLAVLALTLARGLVSAEGWTDWSESLIGPLLYAGSIESARITLSTLAGSMITVAGLVFSVTVVTLSFASSNLGPRLLRNFRSDRINQLVLGCFVASFLYDVTVLSSLHEAKEGPFVPRVAITGALLISTLGFAVLLFFIHHLARQIQADHAISEVREKLDGHVDRLRMDTVAAPEGAADGLGVQSVIRARKSGYVQFIDYEEIGAALNKSAIRARCERRAGDFVLEGASLLEIEGRVGDDIAGTIQEAIVIGAQRTDAQDIEFSILQIVEIALRALSSGINDPFTALACIDHLGAALARLGAGPSPAWAFLSEDRALLYRRTDFRGALDAAWNQIRQAGADQPAVAMRLLEVLGALAERLRHTGDLEQVEQHARKVLDSFRRADAIEADRLEVAGRFQRALEQITQRGNRLLDRRDLVQA